MFLVLSCRTIPYPYFYVKSGWTHASDSTPSAMRRSSRWMHAWPHRSGCRICSSLMKKNPTSMTSLCQTDTSGSSPMAHSSIVPGEKSHNYLCLLRRPRWLCSNCYGILNTLRAYHVLHSLVSVSTFVPNMNLWFSALPRECNHVHVQTGYGRMVVAT